MICKEVDYAAAITQWQTLLAGSGLTADQKKSAVYHLAGLQAEKDMTYHLRVFFGDREAFAVFNNLQVEHNGLTAQIDHLVLTRWTAYFIESKSVSQVITVNEHGEWGRIHNRRFTPIESPLEQSRRHKEVLYNFMTDHRGEFMGTLLGRTLHFARSLTPMHYVAISTHGQIRGYGRRKFPEVMKADQIPHAITAHHETLDTGWFSLSLKDKDTEAFNKNEFVAVLEFLRRHDIAASPSDQVRQFVETIPQKIAPPAQGERDASEAELTEETAQAADRDYACRKCGSKNIAIAHGPYGYYFKCNACAGNTPIVELCEKCTQKMKVSKAGVDYSFVCPKCGQTTPFRTNTAAAPSPRQAAQPMEPKKAPPPTPKCPLCGQEMKLRTARHGQNAGKQFWGCSEYPKCKGILPTSS
jgi:hypothetical protein